MAGRAARAGSWALFIPRVDGRVHPQQTGAAEWKVKATNRLGQSQPSEALWNPAGYMRNVIETVRVQVAG